MEYASNSPDIPSDLMQLIYEGIEDGTIIFIPDYLYLFSLSWSVPATHLYVKYWNVYKYSFLEWHFQREVRREV